MATQLTVADSIDGFLALKTSKAEGYRSDLTVTLNLFAKQCGALQMRHLQPEHVNAVFDKWVLGGNAAGTLNKKRSHVQLWLDYAGRRRQTKATVGELMEGVERRREVPRKRVRLTADQLLTLLELTKHPRDRMYVALAMNTALRASEMVSLKIGDADLAAGWLYVVRHKTGDRDELPITADLDREIRRWLTWYAGRVGKLTPEMCLLPAKGKPVIVGRRVTNCDTELLPLKSMAPSPQLVQRLLRKMDLPASFEGLHTIRRSVARVSYDYYCEQDETRDDALSVVQATLGHSTQAITERYIGVERFKEKRDRAMKGRPFLTAMVDQSNVRRLHGAG